MQLGRYTLVSVLGRGASAVVHLGRDPQGVEVAVKVFHATDPATVARFQREARLLRELGDVPGLAALLDAGEDDRGHPYLVMPCFRGGTLRERLQRGPLPLEQVLDLARTLARALSAIHGLGAVHRDVKPENVLYDARGRPHLTDLGLAKRVAPNDPAAAQLSTTGELRGTFLYMPPEQAGDAKHVGPAADVYALGVVVFECLTGTTPGALLGGLSALGYQERLPIRSWLHERRAETPAEWVDVLQRCLEPDPDLRLADGAAVVAAFDRGAVPGARGRVLAASILLVAGGVAGALIVRGGSSTSAPRSATAPAPQQESPPAPSASPVGLDPAPEPSPADAALDPRQQLAQATLLYHRGRSDRALEALAGVDAPGRLGREIRLLRATTTSRADPEARRALLEDLVQENPDDVVGLTAAARLRGSVWDYDAGIPLAERALALESDFAPALYELGVAYAFRGKPREAAQVLERALALYPDSCVLYRTVGMALRQTDPPGAIDAYTRAIELAEPDVFESGYCWRGWLQHARGELQLARADLEVAVEASAGQSVDALMIRGLVRWDQGDRDGAQADWLAASAVSSQRFVRRLGDLPPRLWKTICAAAGIPLPAGHARRLEQMR